MKKILVACDLDNTLIHSYKYRREDDICVEIFKGREQGFICKDAVKKLVLLNDKVEFIPITTRSIEQYQRIQWEKMVVPEYALTTNGAILLKNGVKDDVWLQESTRIVRKYQGELNRVLEFLEKEEEYIRCKFVDGMYVFCIARMVWILQRRWRGIERGPYFMLFRRGERSTFCPQSLIKEKHCAG